MNKEIKEILDFLEGIVNEKYAMPSEQELLNEKEIKILLDYITNLQEENEKLYIQLEDKANEQIKTMYLEYKSRNEKAIEFCKKYDFILKWQLLEILEGEDKTPQENLYRYTPEKGFELVGGDEEWN